MSKTEKLNEEQIFKQEIADDEMEAIAGGKGSADAGCTEQHFRNGASCANTYVAGVSCDKADACMIMAVVYRPDWQLAPGHRIMKVQGERKSMSLLELAKNRRDAFVFLPEPVPEKMVEEILEIGIQGSSSACVGD